MKKIKAPKETTATSKTLKKAAKPSKALAKKADAPKAKAAPRKPKATAKAAAGSAPAKRVRVRNKPTAEASARKNAVKRDRYAKGKFDVVAVYLDKAMFRVVEKARIAEKGSSRSGIIKAAIAKAYAPHLLLDKATRSSQVVTKKSTTAKKTKNVTPKARSEELPTA